MTEIEQAISRSIRNQYLKQEEKNEIIFNQHAGTCSGFIDGFLRFKKDQIYKLLFPEEIPDGESFTLVFDEQGGKYPQPSTYENDSRSCFIKFTRDVNIACIHFYKGVHLFNLNYTQ